MTARFLPAEEWPEKLRGTALEGAWASLPEDALVGVVEDEHGAVWGCWSFFPVIHAEGLTVKAPKREVWRLLLNELLPEAARRFGVGSVLTASDPADPKGGTVKTMVIREGGKVIPLEFLNVPVPLRGRWGALHKE